MGGWICQCLDLREELEWKLAEGSRNLPARLDAAHCNGCEASTDRAWHPQWGGSGSQLRSFPPLLPEPGPAGCLEQRSISCGERWGPAGVLAGGEELALGVGRQDGNRGGAGSTEREINTNSPSGFSGEMGAQAENCSEGGGGRVCAWAGGYGAHNGAERDWGRVCMPVWMCMCCLCVRM